MAGPLRHMFTILSSIGAGLFVPDADWSGRFVDKETAPAQEDTAEVDDECSESSEDEYSSTDGEDEPAKDNDQEVEPTYLFNGKTRTCHLEKEPGETMCGRAVTVNVRPVPSWPALASRCALCFGRREPRA